jgi:hypothetical protein
VVVQDFITQIMLCVALGCALSPVAAAALSPCRNDAVLGLLPRLAMAAGPVYLVVNYLVYQGTAFAACAAAAFTLGLYILRGWWVPDRVLDFFRHRSQRRASIALRTRVLTVVHDDRRGGRPNADRSMPRAA